MKVFRRSLALAAALAVLAGASALADEKMMSPEDTLAKAKDTTYNNIPYAKLQAMMAKDPAGFMATAKKAMGAGTVLMPGMPLNEGAKSVALTGELIDTNCGSMGLKGHKHAMCARVCVLEGSPVMFLTSDGSAAYAVQGTKAATPASKTVFENVGNQNLKVQGFVNEVNGVAYLSILKINGKAVVEPHGMSMGGSMGM